MYKMTLSDGTEAEFSGLNGTNLIVPDRKEMDTSIFTDDNLKDVTISDGESTWNFSNLEFIQQQHQLDGYYYVCFEEKTKQQIKEDEERDLLVKIAEIEVSTGNLELEDIQGSLQDAVRVKLDDDKWIDK